MKKVITLLALTFCLNTNAQLTTLLDFNDTNGQWPYGSLYYDGTFLYGMTQAGGNTFNFGTIFKIKPDGTGFDTLLNFRGINGSTPRGSLISDGTFLYGMTQEGGTSTACNSSNGGCGTIFKIKPNGTGFTNIFSFNSTNGSYPWGDLYYDGTYLYGMTNAGYFSYGSSLYQDGNIFKIKPDGTAFDTLMSFRYVNGNSPLGSLTSDGTYLYGMTVGGGKNGIGTIFKIKTDGSGFDTLLCFRGATTGQNPEGSLIYDGTYLYGMTNAGGTSTVTCSGYGCGTVFKIKPDGTGFDTLLNFNKKNGGNPRGSLYYDGTYLYGMTSYGGDSSSFCGSYGGCGNIFKIKPDGTGYTDMFNFSDSTSTSTPFGSLISDGTYLYGMTGGGGANGIGRVFKIPKTSVAGIKQFTDNYNQLTIYPNPSNGSFIVETNATSKQNLQVYDVNGRVVLTQTIQPTPNPSLEGNSIAIDASSLPSGIYNASISSHEGVVNKRLVITH